MQHLSEDQLVLYHYGEIRDRPATEQHLASCSACRASYQALQDTLAIVDAAPVPEREETYGGEVWNRLRPRLARRSRFHWAAIFDAPPWALAGAMAGLLVVAFLAGRFSPRPPAPPAPATESNIRERILLVAVGDHLERSQMMLIELAHAKGNGSVDISAEQQRAEDLLDANRLYRQTAATASETAVASVLDDLERVLLDIAHSPSKLSSRELNEIRGRIESQGILFKVRAIGSKVRAREQDLEQAPGGHL